MIARLLAVIEPPRVLLDQGRVEALADHAATLRRRARWCRP